MPQKSITAVGPERLAAILRQQTRAARVKIRDSLRLEGGALRENLRVSLICDGRPEDLVLRSASPTTIPQSHDIAEEFRFQRLAWEAGVPVAEPLWLSQGGDGPGPSFFAMRYLEGSTDPRVLTAPNAPLEGGERLLAELAVALARVHGVTSEKGDADHAGRAIATCRSEIDALGGAFPELEWGLRWCELHRPRPCPGTLVHRDFRSGNFLVAPGGGLAALLDWEFAGWGDPHEDIGWFCARCWRWGRNELEAGGLGAREAFYRDYEAASGRRVDREAVFFWEVLAHIRWAVIALYQGRRSSAQGEVALDPALTGRLRPPQLAASILQMTAPDRWRASTA